MLSGLTGFPFGLSPLPDKGLCSLQERLVMLLSWENQESPSPPAMKQDAEGVVCQRGFVEQLLEVPLSLLFRRPTEPAGVVINDDALSGLNQLANLAPENVLAEFALSGPQVGALDAIIGIEKHEVALGGRLESSLEPVRAGTGALILAVANVLGCGLFVGELVRNRRLSLESQARLKALVETSPAANRDRG